MTSPGPSSSAPCSGRLARSPVVRRDGQWWLVNRGGSILATDPTFTGELDRFAAAMAAADQAVAALRAQPDEPSDLRPRGRR
ncbi:hypothetical protein G3I60_21225 [Streptomyces sp. SID13666]|uniref:hypothetical protein n=1 Tax=unclassified Streptomyces TaxID=2593676 RepID=UPI0013C05FF0|nr:MULTISPECIES: hypothetical protein [unclassified Streptomyces]NEA56588.1 hypothetical protein [Streptomyces sp. SID13666]NEA73032.1 hypothetical protein [Streptomyces sp. SID13588]